MQLPGKRVWWNVYCDYWVGDVGSCMNKLSFPPNGGCARGMKVVSPVLAKLYAAGSLHAATVVFFFGSDDDVEFHGATLRRRKTLGRLKMASLMISFVSLITMLSFTRGVSTDAWTVFELIFALLFCKNTSLPYNRSSIAWAASLLAFRQIFNECVSLGWFV